MQIARTRAELEDIAGGWRDAGLSYGFVPTMGALHAGHLSLVKIALENAGRAVASIFVNPAQFAPHEDFDSYPRAEEKDLEMLRAAGTHLAYLPSAAEIYPHGMDTALRAGDAAHGLESDFRPHFFDGVVNVVSRLFDHVRPDMAIFGEKDYQQLCVIQDMVKNLDLPVRIVGGPIIRDIRGLALSSRNVYLSPLELEIARRLNAVLFAAASRISLDPSAAQDAKRQLLEAGFSKIDYIESRWDRLLAAAWLGKTRLIDNVPI